MMVSKKTRNTLLTASILVLGGGLMAYGAWGFWYRYTTTHNPRPVIPLVATTQSTDTPDETPPINACDSYTVPAHEPRKIELPSINASGCIQKVGIDQHNAIAAPTNIHVAGWYVKSVSPGEKGNSIIDGHLRGRYADGIFAKLGQLRSGDDIRVQMGDKSWRTFTVVHTGNYAVYAAADELQRQPTTTDTQLTLITCGGRYDASAKTYNERMIVRATLK